MPLDCEHARTARHLERLVRTCLNEIAAYGKRPADPQELQYEYVQFGTTYFWSIGLPLDKAICHLSRLGRVLTLACPASFTSREEAAAKGWTVYDAESIPQEHITP